MIGQGKSGWVIAGLCGAIVLTSFGYGMGRRAALKSVASSMNVAPAGSPLPAIQIEPIQPQEELAAINNNASSASGQTVETASSASAENAAAPAAAATAASAKTETAAATEESGRVREIQLALKAAGFDPGSSDGRLGARTKAAVRDFQQANGLNPDGKVGPRTWAKLEPYLKTAKNTTAAPASSAATQTSAQGD